MANIKKLPCLLCATTVLVPATASIVFADGKLVIRPLLSTGISYDSNYYFDQDNEREVYTYHLRPGLQFGYKTAKSSLVFNYLLDANWYDESGTPPAGEVDSGENDYVGHDMELEAKSQVTDRLKLGVSDTYILSRDPAKLDYYSNEILRGKYWQNKLEPEMQYQLGEKFIFITSYRNTIINYEDEYDEDSAENRGSFSLAYDLSPLNTVTANYQLWDKAYDDKYRGYDSHQVMLSFSRELKYYTISAGGGYQHRIFEDPTADDIDDFVWNLSFKGTRPNLEVRLSQNINDTSIAEDYYLGTRLTAAYGLTFYEKIQTKLQGYYQYSDYIEDPEDREDNTAGILLAVDYLRNEYLSFGFKTGYSTRSSSKDGNDYDNLYALLGITINYDLGSR